MTLKEFQERIALSPNKDWYQNYKLRVHYEHIRYATEIAGVVNIYDFVSKQAEGFRLDSNLPDELKKIREFFIDAKAKILTLISNENISDRQWDSSLSAIAGNSPYHKMLLFDVSETIFLLKIFNERPAAFPGAYEFVTSEYISQVEKKEYFEGYMLAYEFFSKDFSQIAERTEAEKKSILLIRNEFDKALQKAESDVVEHFDRTNQKFKDYADQIDILKTEKKVVFDNWFNSSTKAFQDFNSNSKTKIEELENLYQEKLKLEAPAQYWNKRAGRLRKQGYGWLVGFGVCIGIAIYILVWVLDKIADGTMKEIFADTSVAVKWSIALITLISFLAYAIRVVSKLMFSSFHLVRDAEEREQLTYVYLALQNEKGIDKTERHLIMQSLFSRADSGLLKDEGAPTMPGNIFDKFSATNGK